MADFDARINLEVTSNKALNTVNKVEAALDKLNQTAREFGEVFLGKTERRGAFAVAQAQKLAGAIRTGTQEAAKFNAELERAARLQASIQRNRALPPARNAGALPAAGQTSRESIQFRDAIRLADEIDKNYTEAYRQLLKPAEDFRRFAAQISGALNQKLLPAATSGTGQVTRGNNNQVYGPVSGSSRLQQARLQKEVDRQLVELGKLNKETAELVVSYNKRQTSSERLVKTEGRLSTSLETQASNAKKAARSNFNNRAQNVALGVGFPLLFGGGPGAIAGGGLGAIGGGFGGSVIASALGGQIDTFVQGLRDVASALPDASAALDAFEDAGFRVDQSQRAVVDSLVERGLLLDAEKAAIEAINQVLGQGGIENIQKLNTAIEQASKEGNALAEIFAQEVSPALAGYIDLQTETAGILENLVPKIGGFNIALAGLLALIPGAPTIGAAARGLQNRGRNIETETSPNAGIPGFQPGVGFGNDKDINATALAERALELYELQNQVLKNRNEYEEEYKKLLEEDEKLIRRAANAGARALERELKRLEALRERVRLQNELDRIETASIRRQIEFDNKEAQARIEKDAYGLIELNRERELAELAERRQKALARLKPGEQDRIPQINEKFDALEDRARNKALNDQAALVEKRGEAATKEVLALQQQTQLAAALTEEEKRRVKLNQDLAQIKKNEAQYEPGFITQLTEERKALFAAEEAALKYQETLNATQEIAGALSNNVLNGIRAVVEGTATAEEAFASFLNTIVDLLLKAAAEQIAAYIAIGIARQFAGMGGGDSIGDLQSGTAKNPVASAANLYKNREVGGRTMANMPYVVGETGPELFVPGKTGTIVPTDVFEATRNAIQGNAPAGGDSDAFAQNSVAMGNSATITKENSLVREMGMRENEPIDVRYESTVINSVEYVTAEQFQKGISSSVKQSRASVYKDLRNKPAARSGVGI